MKLCIPVGAIAPYENGELEAVMFDSGGGCGGQGQGHGGACHGGSHRHTDHRHATSSHGCHGSGCGDHGHDHESGACGVSQSAPPAAARKPAGDVAKIAVCSQNRKKVTEHAGKCRKFWIYDVTKGEVTSKTLLELPLEQSLHASPPHQPHPLDAVDVLITTGMGAGLQQRLLRRGIQGVVTTETDPDQAVAAVLAGALERLPPEDRTSMA